MLASRYSALDSRTPQHGVWVFIALTSLACEPNRKEPAPAQATEPSPNASILPAPLATNLTSGRKVVTRDAGPPADAGSDAGEGTKEILRDDRALQPEAEAALRDAAGLRARARLRWLDLPAFPRLPESNVEATQRLRDGQDFELSFEVSALGRLRVVLDSDGFVLPRGTEFRSRNDQVGHLLVWRSGTRYTALPPGTLRAVLTERRIDAAPLVKPKRAAQGTGTALGLSTEKRELTTPLGRLIVEQANLAAAGAGAELVCRWLVEWIAADPLNAGCERALLPVRAELFSGGGGHVAFEVVRLDRDPIPQFDPDALLVPPARASFAQGELPPESPWLVPPVERLRELRVKAAPRTEKPVPSAPKQGLLLQNRSESLRYVLLDGLVLARVPPRRDLHVEGLLPGKYALATFDFLGDDPTPLRIVEVPTRVALGEEVEPGR